VALLGGLVVVCACRPILERLLPDTNAVSQRPVELTTGRRAGGAMPGLAVRGGLTLAVVGLVGAAIVWAGGPARGVVVASAEDVLGRVPVEVDPGTFPSIAVDQGVVDWNHEITGPGAREIVLTLAENLQLENQALLRADPTILEAVDHGDRLDEMRERLHAAEADGKTVVEQHQFDDVHLTLIVPFGKQDGLSLGLESRGEVTTETYDAAGNVQARTSSPFAKTFVMRRATGDRWLNVAVLEPAADA
jgi:hypothetical protein